MSDRARTSLYGGPIGRERAADTVDPMTRARMPFRTEAAMAPHLKPHVKALTGDPVSWFTEVPAANGIPDVVLVRFDRSETRRRNRHGLVMPDDLGCVRTVLALTDSDPSGATAREIAAMTGLSVDVVRRRALPRLADAGWIVRTGQAWAPTQPYADPAQFLVTIELKLRDWRGALAQALQARASSDMSWVILGHPTTKALEQLKHFEIRGIGLGLLDCEDLRIVQTPRQAGCDPARRALLAERLLAMRAAGTSAGPGRHVFGRVLT
jgi:hypothetical protein